MICVIHSGQLFGRVLIANGRSRYRTAAADGKLRERLRRRPFVKQFGVSPRANPARRGTRGVQVYQGDHPLCSCNCTPLAKDKLGKFLPMRRLLGMQWRELQPKESGESGEMGDLISP